ncbi:hypothetical protein SPRG_07768 [Saprolegnia parasitica CBS 223.65]|uniref:Pentacotripeptide-repeat region of PRORP domain-containing protein n=1 Tax=Saprolegnia parasitica (strain CBS 223.65) TaxID=695850 RepID=A0A067CJS0_SAPPC|nr:hypothetical protein SPRG_07768 [Saprolegnia parasitica CBS 223.65]KDO27057.1 hypothetical protein SPRG_07768 [Saprolegnia parasitica CBS 223.65]|eukprot:XP_012202152.1 hypothetical protein SPRG_07768 [Saprolegnia parasitica CBS 223.65]
MLTRRCFSTAEIALAQLINPTSNHKAWRHALTAWSSDKWRDVLRLDATVADHQRAFATILQDHGPMNHFYLLKQHPGVAPELLDLFLDATRVYPYEQVKYREMDLIKILRQMALATSEDVMVTTAIRALLDLASSSSSPSDVLHLYKSLVAASFEPEKIPDACLQDAVTTLLAHDHIDTAIDLLADCKDTTEMLVPIDLLIRVFEYLGRHGSIERATRTVDLAFEWNLPAEATTLAASMLTACLGSGHLSLALDVFDAIPSEVWAEPSVYALASALPSSVQFKTDLMVLHARTTHALSPRVLERYLLLAQQVDAPAFLRQLLDDAAERGWSMDLLITCAKQTPHSPDYEQLAATLLLHQLETRPSARVEILATFKAHVWSKTWLRIANLMLAQQVRDAPSRAVALYTSLFASSGDDNMHVRSSLHPLLLNLANHGHIDEVLALLTFAKAMAIKPRADDLATVAAGLAKHPLAALHARPLLATYIDLLTSMRIPTTLRVWRHMILLANATHDPTSAFAVYAVMQDKRIKMSEAIALELLRAARKDFGRFTRLYADAMAANAGSTRLFGFVLKTACYEQDPAFLRRVLSDIAASAFSSRAAPTASHALPVV